MRFSYRSRLWAAILLLLSFTAVAVYGQEATPDQPSSPVEVVQRYFETGDPNLLNENVQFADPWSTQPIVGRDAVGMLGDNYYGLAYNLDLEPWRYLHAEDMVVVEFQYRDPNAAVVAVPSVGLDRDVPMIGIYQVEDGQITSSRVYYSSMTLQTQLGATGAPGIGAAPGAPLAGSPEAREFSFILNDPASFFGQEVIVEGLVGRAIDDRAFVLHQFDVVTATGQGEILIVDGTQEGLNFVQLADALVRIEGTVQSFDLALIESETGVDFNDADYVDYQGQAVIIATSATNLDDVFTLGNLANNPEAFYNQDVTIEGNVGRAVSNQAFVLYQGGLGGGNEVLVVRDLEQSEGFIQLADAYVRVQGTVVAFNTADIESQVGADLDASTFAEFENMPVIVASTISNLDDVMTIQNVATHPEAFYGSTLTLEGTISDATNPQIAFLNEDAVLGVDRILIVGTTGEVYDFTQAGNQRVRVTGTIHPFTATDIQTDYGVVIDEGAYADYEGQPVMVAEQVTPIE